MPTPSEEFDSAPDLSAEFDAAPDDLGAAFDSAPDLAAAFDSAPDESAPKGGMFSHIADAAKKVAGTVQQAAPVAQENALRSTLPPEPSMMEQFAPQPEANQSSYGPQENPDGTPHMQLRDTPEIDRTIQKRKDADEWANAPLRMRGANDLPDLTASQHDDLSTVYNTGIEAGQNVVRPFAEAEIQQKGIASKLAGIGLPGAGAATELLQRNAMSSYAGHDVIGYMDPAQVALARARLPEWNLPLLGTTHPAEFMAELGGNPANLIPGVGAEEMVASATGGVAKTMLGKVAQFTVSHAVEGAMQGGAAAAVDPNMSIGAGMAGGAFLAPVAGGAFKGVGKAVSSKPVAILTKEMIPQFVDELRGQLSKLQFAEPEFAGEPSFIVTHSRVNPDGKVTFHATAVKVENGNTVRIAELPLNTSAERAKFRNFVKRHDTPAVIHDKSILTQLGAEQGDTAVHELIQKPSTEPKLSEEAIREGVARGEYQFSYDRLGSGEDAQLRIRVKDSTGKVIHEEVHADPVKGEVSKPPAPPKEALTTPDPDAPPQAVNDEDIIVVSDGQTAKLKSPEDAQPTTAWQDAQQLAHEPVLSPPPKERILKSTGNAPEKVGPDELAKAFPNAKAAVDAQSTGARSSGSPPKGANESSARQPTPSEPTRTPSEVRTEPIKGKKGWVRKTLPDGRVFEVDPAGNHKLIPAGAEPAPVAVEQPKKGITKKNVKREKNVSSKLLKSRSVTVEGDGPGTSVTVGNMTQQSPHFETPAKDAGALGGEAPPIQPGEHGEPFHSPNGDLNIRLTERPNQELVKMPQPGPNREPVLTEDMKPEHVLPSGDKAVVEFAEPGGTFHYGEGDIGGGGGGGRGQWKSPGEPPISEGPVVQPLPERPDVWNGPLTEAQARNFNLAEQAIEAARKAGPAFKQTWNKVLRTFLSPQHYGPPIKQEAARKLLGARAMFAPDETYRALEKRLIAAGAGDAAKPNSEFARDLQRMAEGEVHGVYSSPIRHDNGPGASRELLGKVRREVVDEKYMMDHHPQAWTAVKEMARDLMVRAEDNGRELANLLGDAGEDYLLKLQQLRDDGLWELYVARMYRSHMLGKDWAKAIPHESLNNGIEFVWHELLHLRQQGESDYAKALRKLPEDELYSHAAKEVSDLIGMRDPSAAYADKVRGKAGPWAHLRTRDNEIPKPIQELLGKETSGLIRLSHTLAVQDFMIHSIKVWNTLADAGISAPVKTLEHTVEVPNIPQRYGRMAGQWLKPEYGDLVGFGNAPEQALQILRTVAAPFKFMNVIGGGLTTWTNNFYGNWWHAVLAGGLDPFRPGESGRAYSLAWHMLVNDRANGAGFGSRIGAVDKISAALGDKQAPLEVVGKATQLGFWNGHIENAEAGRAAARAILDDPEAMAGLLREARAYGVDAPGQMGVEVGGKKHDRISRALHQEMVKLGPNAGLMDYWRVGKRVIGQFKNATVEELSHTYDLIDRTSKLASYISLRQKFLREAERTGIFERWGEALPPKDAIKYAANKAAEQIQMSYPDYRSMGKLPEALANIPLLTNPFVRFLLETVRIHAMLPKRMATDPSLVARMGFATAAAYTLTNGLAMMRRVQGISDEEADAALKNHTARTGSYRPLVFAMPWRNSDNEPALLDLSQIWSPSVFFGGNREDATGISVAGQQVVPPTVGLPGMGNLNVGIKNAVYGVIHNTAGDLTAPAVDKMMNDAGLYRSFKDYQTLEADRGWQNLVLQGIKSYTIPRAVTRPIDQYMQANDPNKSRIGPKPTLDQMVGNAMGIPLVPGGGPDSAAYKQAQLSDLGAVNDAFGDMSMSINAGKAQQGVPLDKERIQQLSGTLKDRRETNEAAKRRLFRK